MKICQKCYHLFFPPAVNKLKRFFFLIKWLWTEIPMVVGGIDIIRLCLTLWCRSPRGYGELRNSKILILPSEKLLQNFKNSIKQETGINKDILHWMSNEAKVKKVHLRVLKVG